jgi:hypothetical protein
LCFPWSQASGSPITDVPIAGTNASLRDTGDAYSLLPVVLHDSANVYGQLDGVYHITGFNNVVENTLTIDGKDYVVMQGVYRTGFSDYYALELN